MESFAALNHPVRKASDEAIKALENQDREAFFAKFNYVAFVAAKFRLAGSVQEARFTDTFVDHLVERAKAKGISEDDLVEAEERSKADAKK